MALPEERKHRIPLFLLRCLFVGFFLFTQICIIYLIARPINEPKWFMHPEKQSADLLDFYHYYESGQFALSKELGYRAYDPQTQLDWTNNLIKPYHTDDLFYNNQVPFMFPMMIPIGLMPYNWAYVSWCTVSFIFCIFVLYRFCRNFRKMQPKESVYMIMGILSSLPAYLTVWHGQLDYFILALICLYIWCAFERKDIRAGIMLALTTLKFNYSLMLLIPVLLEKRGKLFISFVATGIALLVLSSFFIGWQSILDFPAAVLSNDAKKEDPTAHFYLMVGLRGLLTHFLPADVNLHIALVAEVLALAFVVWLWYRTTCTSQANIAESKKWAYSITIITSLLISPHTHMYDCLFLAMCPLLTMTLPLTAATIDKDRIWYITWLCFPIVSWLGNFLLPHDYTAIVLTVLMVMSFIVAMKKWFRITSREES
jgi:hypothetical protein